MAMNFDDMIIEHTNKNQEYSKWDMESNYESNNEPRDDVKYARKVSDNPEYNSNLTRSSLEYKYHHTFVDSMRCRFNDTKLSIVNLHERVTVSDIEILFNVFESYKFCKMHYDDNGCPLGSAVVIFGRKKDAIKAIDLYNGLKLDGQVLNIKLTVSEYPDNPSESELSSVYDFKEADNFSEQRVLEQELDALFHEFVRNRRSRSTSIRLM